MLCELPVFLGGSSSAALLVLCAHATRLTDDWQHQKAAPMVVRPQRLRTRLSLAGLMAAALLGTQTSTHSASPAAPLVRPNILFIMLDDVGKDQLASFNPAAGTAALTPNLNAIVSAGVRFTNVWAMSECSPEPGLVLHRTVSAPHRRHGGHSRSGLAGGPDLALRSDHAACARVGRLPERHAGEVPPGRTGEQPGWLQRAGGHGLGLLQRQPAGRASGD